MKVFIHSLDKTLFEGEASVAILPAESGEVSILNKHIPLVTSLKKGTIRIKGAEAQIKNISILSGFAEINPERITVLVNQ